jgi:hypothetical protein
MEKQYAQPMLLSKLGDIAAPHSLQLIDGKVGHQPGHGCLSIRGYLKHHDLIPVAHVDPAQAMRRPQVGKRRAGGGNVGERRDRLNVGRCHHARCAAANCRCHCFPRISRSGRLRRRAWLRRSARHQRNRRTSDRDWRWQRDRGDGGRSDRRAQSAVRLRKRRQWKRDQCGREKKYTHDTSGMNDTGG